MQASQRGTKLALPQPCPSECQGVLQLEGGRCHTIPVSWQELGVRVYEMCVPPGDPKASF